MSPRRRMRKPPVQGRAWDRRPAGRRGLPDERTGPIILIGRKDGSSPTRKTASSPHIVRKMADATEGSAFRVLQTPSTSPPARTPKVIGIETDAFLTDLPACLPACRSLIGRPSP